MTVTITLTFIGHLKAVDLTASYLKLLPGTADPPETLQLCDVSIINLTIRDNLPVLIPLNAVMKIISILCVFIMMNTPEAKNRTGLGSSALMGHVEALKECLSANTLFERLERRNDLLFLRLD
jgi:hypothetical protein